jgi:hypothetical protein
MERQTEESDEIRSELGQSIVLVGMSAIVIVAGLLIGLVA